MPETLGNVLKTLKERARREGRAREFAALDEHFRAVAYQLEALRIRQGMTQRELARRTDIDQAEVSRILSGQTQPRIDTAERIARALGAEIRVVRTVSARTTKAPHPQRRKSQGMRSGH